MLVNNLNVDINEILRYLGHKDQSIDENTNELIRECIDEIQKDFGGKYVYNIYDIKTEKDTIKLLNTTISLPGINISHHLKECTKCILMAVTLGSSIDRIIIYYMKEHISKGIIYDACSTAFVEALCDFVEGEISSSLEKNGLTTRFSPGYGDLPISIQPEILKVLDTYRKIGLATNESFILTPRKSVTAIIGIGANVRESDKYTKCIQCIKHGTCSIRKEGDYCGV